jgi:proline dehydrogenase
VGLWQRSMIALAVNKPAARLVQGQPTLASLSRRFVGGSNLAEAVQTAEKLELSGKLASLFYLGEYVSDPALVARTVSEYMAAAPALVAAGLDVHLSVDPTAIGSLISEDACRDNAFRIARAVAGASDGYPANRAFLMLDMEDSSVTESTIRLYEDLRAANLPAAVTLQAYLHRYEKDVKRCVVPGGRIRLVKGALAEPSSRAATTRADIDRRFRWAAETMLSPEAREMGFYPIFATHDVPMIRFIRRTARSKGWTPGTYEFEMLYGVRPRLQDALVAEERLRLYLPFGEAWFPYAIRRIGENPRNVPLLMRAMLNARHG